MRLFFFTISGLSFQHQKPINKNILFQSRFLDILFLIFLYFFKNGRFWEPLQNPVGAKMAFKIDQVPPTHRKTSWIGAPRTCSLFSRNHSNYRAVGTSWLLIGHLFIFTIWEFLDFFRVDIFRFVGSKNIFNLCSNIELNTPNPNPIFKIAICFTKTPQMQKYFRNLVFFSKI